nr:hypothetical protein RAR13_01250 [Aminobacter aminovorans]
MNNRVDDEPSELSFKDKKGQGSLTAIGTISFDRLSTALIYAVETMHDSHRSRCMITTLSGSVYDWREIVARYDQLKISQ